MITLKKRTALFLSMSVIVGMVFLVLRGCAIPQEACQTTTVREEWSSDRVYKASLLRKSCNMDESIFYSVRIDFKGSAQARGWFSPGLEIEDDEYPTEDPLIHWAGNRRLEISLHTRTLRGSLSQNMGRDLVVVRSYVAKEPDAFSNY